MSHTTDRRPLADVSSTLANRIPGTSSGSGAPFDVFKPVGGRHAVAAATASSPARVAQPPPTSGSSKIAFTFDASKTLQSPARVAGASGGKSEGAAAAAASVGPTIVTPKKRRMSQTEEELDQSSSIAHAENISVSTGERSGSKGVASTGPLFMSPPRRQAVEAVAATPDRIPQTPPRSSSCTESSNYDGASESTPIGGRRKAVVPSPSRENSSTTSAAVSEAGKTRAKQQDGKRSIPAPEIFDDFASSRVPLSVPESTLPPREPLGVIDGNTVRVTEKVPRATPSSPEHGTYNLPRKSNAPHVSFREPLMSEYFVPPESIPQHNGVPVSEPSKGASSPPESVHTTEPEIKSSPAGNQSSEATGNTAPAGTKTPSEAVDLKKMRARYSKPLPYTQPIEMIPISDFHASVTAASSFAIRSLLQKRYYDEVKQSRESKIAIKSKKEHNVPDVSQIFDEVNTSEGSMFSPYKYSSTESPSSVSSSVSSSPFPSTTRHIPVVMPTLKNKGSNIFENTAFREKMSLWRHQYGPPSPEYSIPAHISPLGSDADGENIDLISSALHRNPSLYEENATRAQCQPASEPVDVQRLESGSNTSFWRQRWEQSKSSHTTASTLIAASQEAQAKRDLRISRHPLQDIRYQDAASMTKLTHLFEEKLSASSDR